MQRTMLDAGIAFDRDRLPKLVMTLDGVPDNLEELTLLRQEKSHRGLSKFKRLRHLWAGRVNQEMIDEISGLPDLEILRIKNMSAASLEPLAQNRKLKRLIIHGGNKVPNMEWTRGLPPTLEVLHLESLFRATEIGPLAGLSQLKTLGLEGGIDRKLELKSLEPLGALSNLQYLFLAATRVADKSLAPLHGLKKLKHLGCGAFFPDAEFVALQKALPGLDCSWIEMIRKHGSVKAGLARSRRA
jgi:Leucine-rich repeat (LRR) protein